MRNQALVFAMVLGISAVPARAETNLILHQRVTVGSGAPYEETQFFSDGKSVRDDPQQRTVVDLDAKSITTLTKASKMYKVARLDDVRRQDEEQRANLARLPAAARKTLGIDEPVALKPTGQTQEIAGYKAKEYAISAGGVSGTVWVTDAIDPGAGAYAWENRAGLTGGARGGPAGKLAEALARLKGLPLRTVLTVGSGAARVTTTIDVLQIEKKALPDDLLEVPRDYRSAQGL